MKKMSKREKKTKKSIIIHKISKPTPQSIIGKRDLVNDLNLFKKSIFITSSIFTSKNITIVNTTIIII